MPEPVDDTQEREEEPVDVEGQERGQEQDGEKELDCLRNKLEWNQFQCTAA